MLNSLVLWFGFKHRQVNHYSAHKKTLPWLRCLPCLDAFVRCRCDKAKKWYKQTWVNTLRTDLHCPPVIMMDYWSGNSCPRIEWECLSSRVNSWWLWLWAQQLWSYNVNALVRVVNHGECTGQEDALNGMPFLGGILSSLSSFCCSIPLLKLQFILSQCLAMGISGWNGQTWMVAWELFVCLFLVTKFVCSSVLLNVSKMLSAEGRTANKMFCALKLASEFVCSFIVQVIELSKCVFTPCFIVSVIALDIDNLLGCTLNKWTLTNIPIELSMQTTATTAIEHLFGCVLSACLPKWFRLRRPLNRWKCRKFPPFCRRPKCKWSVDTCGRPLELCGAQRQVNIIIGLALCRLM